MKMFMLVTFLVVCSCIISGGWCICMFIVYGERI